MHFDNKCLYFIRSTAIGIDFYRNKKIEGLKDSEETVNFTLIVNDFFDALKRKYPAEGIKKDSHDLKVFYVLHVPMFVFCDNFYNFC